MRNVFLLMLLLFSSSAYSAGYSLTFQGQTVVGYEYESTCQQLAAAINADWGYTAYYYHEVNYDSASPRCRIGAQGGANPKYITFTDAGLECPEGTTEDFSTGECIEVDCPPAGTDIQVVVCNYDEGGCPTFLRYENCSYDSCHPPLQVGWFEDQFGNTYQGGRQQFCSTGYAAAPELPILSPDLNASDVPDSTYQAPSEETNTINDPQVTTSPNGDKTTVESEHYQSRPGTSGEVTQQPTSTSGSTARTSTGQQLDIYDTKTTTEHADGSTTVTTQKKTQQKTPTITEYTTDENGALTEIIIEGWELVTFEETTTNTYDADGNLTGSSTVTKGDSSALDNTNGLETGNPGTSNDNIHTTGDGDGEGECDPILEDCGNAPFQGTDKDGLYEKTDKTYQSVLTEFKNRVSDSSIGSAMTGFFDFNVSGSCPTWQVDTGYVGVINIDAQCSQAMNSIWPLISAILLAVAGFFAWRVATE
jgi:hypothetical protein